MTKLRIGIIGCGGRGRAHALGYQQSQDVQMVACADPFTSAAERMAGDFGFRAIYTDYRAMLAEQKLDIVSMALWTGLHHDAVMACIEAPTPPRLINAEKPMAPTFGESRHMHEACEQAGIMLTFSHQRRFGPTFAKARELLKDGAIGELIRLEGFCPNLFDWGTHWFDMMFFYNDDVPAQWVMGQIDCAEDRLVFGTPVETSGLSYVRWSNGVTGLLATGEDHGGRCQNRLIGTDGMIEVDRQVRMLRAGREWEIVAAPASPVPGGDTTVYILEAIDCLRSGRESLLSSRKALQATELIFATYESSRRRARVTLPLDVTDSPLISMLESGQVVIPAWPAEVSRAEQADGFAALFNGRDFHGWDVLGPTAETRIQKGVILCEGGVANWLCSRDSYADFALRFQYRTTSRAMGRMVVRAGDPLVPSVNGIDIPLCDDVREPASRHSTGALAGLRAPTTNAANPAGKWNDIEVRCTGATLRLEINGKAVQDCRMSDAAELVDTPPSGHIAFACRQGMIEFRGIRLKVLA